MTASAPARWPGSSMSAARMSLVFAEHTTIRLAGEHVAARRRSAAEVLPATTLFRRADGGPPAHSRLRSAAVICTCHRGATRSSVGPRVARRPLSGGLFSSARAGWNRDDMRNHGTTLAKLMRSCCERVEAMSDLDAGEALPRIPCQLRALWSLKPQAAARPHPDSALSSRATAHGLTLTACLGLRGRRSVSTNEPPTWNTGWYGAL